MRRFDGRRLLVATHNAGKLAEMQALLAPFGVTVIGAAEAGLSEPAETEQTFLGNARIKARAAVAATGLPALSDDSGICIDALDGAPGVHTADWAETGHGRDFAMAMERTWRALEDAGAPEPRQAQFRCTLVLMWPDGHDAVFEGTLPGRVVWPPRGAEGHGYDPIFMPEGHDVTLGEMQPALKNSLSHRARAVAKMIEGCFA
ncbi:MAG: RdgB/HAM1 family non-canonical purine NTP pyrophosphatase [Paracoccus sp. (in: a-proteobacteria)]|uniref:RdgB/HAM1 family non-canonical purine NTP pyrophosphatase n=1 Tax=unclassified Paracoccus (in: a-proteobacteria) TaxID=2688777 RepID=UPI000C35CCD3|nr:MULTISPECIES: RdgB/HAM1 family non-canonical purine NTP pyrophosphatase [unclassified Paracoccus (in: a-proteobacteria)]MAN56857.1 non-canonical purine NTP pyrophosphatase, RdgB/HAM1 family [Paracoccus sp. (in: a-proteobacteria)]MBA48543.1 non-canonical purine NTP pyrophosphatase, RdgB/HAM1 family [Paracoccus sp. (in: a-proteobacteria)]MCS5601619.1 RdgB/HAM1 family non-canonical purine NTP pyrophosphatase [Paracoccus sp. (in: a-proteobacteria)]MDB2490554.1 RdgB/HAM1 family non-canonical puri|tara:strand:- start:698 stop:1306 length:609 start_codon:yes stop_codon:yes gene_type:complete